MWRVNFDSYCRKVNAALNAADAAFERKAQTPERSAKGFAQMEKESR
jgi:hypothetical protein